MRIALWMLALAVPVTAAQISFTAIDLADVTPGEDLWRYDYRVSDTTFQANQGFSIGFAPTLFRSLLTPVPPAPQQWDILAIQPNPILPANGLYDALALVDNAPTTQLFSIEFVFAGPGVPGSQPFTLNQFDANGQFLGTFGSGQTVPDAPVGAPEPLTGELVAVSVLGIAAVRRRATR